MLIFIEKSNGERLHFNSAVTHQNVAHNKIELSFYGYGWTYFVVENLTCSELQSLIEAHEVKQHNLLVIKREWKHLK